MISNFTQTKICVEKILPKHQVYIDHVKKNSNSPDHSEKLLAAFYSSKIWPKGAKISIAFLETGNQIVRTPLSSLQNVKDKQGYSLKIDPLQFQVDNLSVQEAVMKVVRERIQPLVNLKIEFVKNPSQANVRISFDPNGGAWSLIGTDCLHENPSKPTMNLGWFDVATTIHEFGHVLGMIHEHQNPKGRQIPWDDARVYKWAKETQGWDHETTYQNIIQKYKKDLINGSEFDPLSIMLYFFSGNLTTTGVGTHENLRLSGYDVDYISKMYPGGPVSPEDFYQNVYGESLKNALEDIQHEQGHFGEESNHKLIWIIVGIVGGIIIISFLIWFFGFRKKSYSSRRYTSRMRFGRQMNLKY